MVSQSFRKKSQIAFEILANQFLQSMIDRDFPVDGQVDIANDLYQGEFLRNETIFQDFFARGTAIVLLYDNGREKLSSSVAYFVWLSV